MREYRVKDIFNSMGEKNSMSSSVISEVSNVVNLQRTSDTDKVKA
jgi:hypothetical protein